jgi:hypothetical protein
MGTWIIGDDSFWTVVTLMQVVTECVVPRRNVVILLSLTTRHQKERKLKNIQVFDGAENAVYDIFAATDEEFALIFPDGTDVAFIDEVYERHPEKILDTAFNRIWERRVPKRQAMGIHGILFYECEHKKVYYPTRRDEEAINPGGSALR